MAKTKKRLLTVDDLVKFCQSNNLTTFSSEESGYQLAVQIPTSFDLEDSSDNSHRGMCRLKVKILHDGLNRNGSYVSRKAAEAAAKTISDRPILAAIHQLDDGSWDFEGHEIKIVENEDGEDEIEYIEKQVGSFSSEEPFWEHDDELNKDFLCAYAYIAEDYTRAADIIREKEWTKNSCELSIEKFTYNAKERYLDLQEFYVSASTLLGSHDDGTEIGEGMLGSRADIIEFSEERNSVLMLEMLEKLNEKIDQLSIENSKKGGNDEVDNFELEEEITVEESTEEVETPSEEFDEAGETEAGAEVETEIDSEGAGTEAEVEVEEEESMQYAVSFNGSTRIYSVSLKDKLCALLELVNESYGEMDNTWYDVDAYDDEKVVYMHDYWNDRHFKQSYAVKKDVYSLKGDRVQVYSRYLTQDEINTLDQMQANYSVIEDELNKFKAEPDKMEILNSEDYSSISELEEFEELKKQESHFDMSVDEVRSKADQILLSAAKNGKVGFAAEAGEDKKVTSSKRIPVTRKNKSGRYGNLFSNR